MKKRFSLGCRLCFLSALALMLLTGWELVIRLDAMYKPLNIFFELASGENISPSVAMEYFDFSILHQPLYLVGCLITGILSIIFCRRARLCFFLLPVCLLLGIAGYRIESIPLFYGWKLIRTLPLLSLSVGSILNLAGCLPRRRPGEPASPRLNDAPRLRALSRPSREDDRRSA